MSELHRIAGCENAQLRADALFIHGLGGGAFATWHHGLDKSASWLDWLAQDFPDVAVWSLGYAASPTVWTRLPWPFLRRGPDSGYSMPLQDRADQVLQRMAQYHLGQRPLLLICHSLGGLVAKQMLRTSRDDIENRLVHDIYVNTKAVLFLATPHAGARLASFASAFWALSGATVSLRDLRAHSSLLRDLMNWYRMHAAAAGIDTRTFRESRRTWGVRVVDPTSANCGVGKAIALDANHFSIAKPRDRTSQVYIAAKEQLECILSAQRQPSTAEKVEQERSLLRESPTDPAVTRSLLQNNLLQEGEIERLKAREPEQLALWVDPVCRPSMKGKVP